MFITNLWERNRFQNYSDPETSYLESDYYVWWILPVLWLNNFSLLNNVSYHHIVYYWYSLLATIYCKINYKNSFAHRKQRQINLYFWNIYKYLFWILCKESKGYSRHVFCLFVIALFSYRKNLKHMKAKYFQS